MSGGDVLGTVSPLSSQVQLHTPRFCGGQNIVVDKLQPLLAAQACMDV
jgi:hypothetical protein